MFAPENRLTLHQPQQDQRGQAHHRHGEEQYATAAASVDCCPKKQPGSTPGAHREQVHPVETGTRASDVTSERAVTVRDAVRDEPESRKTGATRETAVETGFCRVKEPSVDSRDEAQHTHVLPDVLAVEELVEGQVGLGGGGRLRLQLCRRRTRTGRDSLSDMNLSLYTFIHHFLSIL